MLHLDQFFDYAVPEELDEAARPGVRVRVRFGAGAHQVKNGRREGGRLIDGFLVERRAESDYSGPLAALADVVSPEPVLGPELLGLARAVADRYAGSLADVLQLAVPPRSAAAERRPSPEPLPPPSAPEPGSWTRYEQGPAFLDSLAHGGAPRAVWNALPGPYWAEEIARAVAATLASGRGALVVVPDGRAADRVDAALTGVLGRGGTRCSPPRRAPRSGTRAGSPCGAGPCGPSSAPGPRCSPPYGTSGSSSSGTTATAATASRTPRSPTRARCSCCAPPTTGALPPGQHELHRRGRPARRDRLGPGADRRTRAGPRRRPLIRTVGDGELARDEAARAARLPSLAWQTVREGLKTGPVLVQVPRRGTCRGWPASAAGRPPAAGTAPGPWRPPGSGSCAAAGAGAAPRLALRWSAARPDCAPRWSARGGLPRNSAGLPGRAGPHLGP